MLARRELPVEGVRARLLDRGFAADDVESAIVRLSESGALDDARVARAYARTAVNVKGRGRLRVRQELLQMGIHGDVIAEALAEVFGDVDERALIAQALQKKLRGRTKLADRQEYARLYRVPDAAGLLTGRRRGGASTIPHRRDGRSGLSACE